MSAALGKAVDVILPKDEKKILSNRDIVNVIGTSALTAALSRWATRKQMAQKVIPTRSTSYLFRNYGMPVDKAEAFTKQTQVYSAIAGGLGAGLSALFSRIVRAGFKAYDIDSDMQAQDQPDIPVEPE